VTSFQALRPFMGINMRKTKNAAKALILLKMKGRASSKEEFN
jgi:hypothetical protein